MLEKFFVRPTTVDRIRASWIGAAIEQYVVWLTERGYAARSVFQRVPLLVRFGEYARERGATSWEALPEHVEPFVEDWLAESGKLPLVNKTHNNAARSIRGPLHQLLRVVLPSYGGGIRGRGLPRPFRESVPGFFPYLVRERGLSKESVVQYEHHLRCFEAYLSKIGLVSLGELSPTVLSGYVTNRSQALGKGSVHRLCSVLKIFLQYVHREGLTRRDLRPCIEPPQQYRHADIPRSITWAEVSRLLESIDRRSSVGKRDYAILLLLVTYGLRGREVAALRVDDIDWRRERLHVPERKAGHSTTFPLSPIVGQAIVDYLKEGRPPTSERAIFLRAMAPHTSVTHGAISQVARRAIRKAGIEVLHPGSHTLRHTCVQRLVDSHVSLKTIGDYMGHRTAVATGVYAKIDVEALRKIAMGDGEAVL